MKPRDEKRWRKQHFGLTVKFYLTHEEYEKLEHHYRAMTDEDYAWENSRAGYGSDEFSDLISDMMEQLYGN